MQEIIQFVSNSIESGIIGNLAYASLKKILGSSWKELSSYLSNKEYIKFENKMEEILKNNQEVKKEIIKLQKNNQNITNINKGDIQGIQSQINKEGSNTNNFFGTVINKKENP